MAKLTEEEDDLLFIMSLRIGSLVRIIIDDQDIDSSFIGTVNGITNLFNNVEYGISIKGDTNIYPVFCVAALTITDEFLFKSEMFSFNKGFWSFISDSKIQLKKKIIDAENNEDAPDVVYSLIIEGITITDLYDIHDIQNVLFDLKNKMYYFDSSTVDDNDNDNDE